MYFHRERSKGGSGQAADVVRTSVYATRQHGQRSHRQRRRDRPSLVVVLLACAGIWASVATGAPQTSAQDSGSVIVDAEQPAVRLAVDADGGDQPDVIDLRVEWSLSSESGIDPEVSVVGLDSTVAIGSGVPLRRVELAQATGEIELSVINIDETGPVTIDWQASASVEGSDVDLTVTTNVAVGQPAPAVVLPTMRAPYGRLRVPFVFFEVWAAFGEQAQPAGGDSLTIGRTDDRPNSEVVAIVDGALVPVPPGQTGVPTEGTTCVDRRCTTSFTLATELGAELRIDSGDGSVTAIASAPESEVVWVALAPRRLLSEVHDFTLDVALAEDEANPFADRAMLVVRVPDSDDPIVGMNCFVPVEYSLDGGPYEELASFVTDEAGGELLPPGGRENTSIELRIGTTDAGQYCDADAAHETVVEIGIMTLGLASPLPAEVVLK